MTDRTIPLYPRTVLNKSLSFFEGIITATMGLITSSLTVNGNQTVNGTDTVSGSTNVTGIVNVTGDLIVGNGINVTGGTITPTPTGSIMPSSSGTVPPDFLPCNGGSYLRALYPDLFAVIGTMYGSTGPTTFNVPDLRSRVIIGVDGGAGRLTTLPNILADTGGAESHTLTISETPVHNHTASLTSTGGHSHSFIGTATSSTESGHTHTATATETGPHSHSIRRASVNGIRTTTPVGGMWDLTFPPGLETLVDGNPFYTDTTTSAGGGFTLSGSTPGSEGGHSHTFSATGATGSGSSHAHIIPTTTSAGIDGPHPNLQPYFVINYVIKT